MVELVSVTLAQLDGERRDLRGDYVQLKRGMRSVAEYRHPAGSSATPAATESQPAELMPQWSIGSQATQSDHAKARCLQEFLSSRASSRLAGEGRTQVNHGSHGSYSVCQR